MKKFIKRVIILLVLAGIVFAVAMYKPSTKAGVIPYRTDTVTRGTIANVITATGSISPEKVVTLGTQVSGQITAVYVKLNDTVKKGQLLAEVDPSIALTQLKQSKANLQTSALAAQLASRDYERTKALVAKEYVPKVDLERSWQALVNANTAVDLAKLQVERDEVNLGYTKVTSPIDGIIIAQEVASGETVASNFQTPNLFKIAASLDKMKIDMNVPESDISKIHVGMPVKFSVDAFPDKEFAGVVSVIDLNPNNQSGIVTYNVVVTLENKDRLLFPGMTANVTITLSEVKDVLRVPSSALRFSPPEQSRSSIAQLLSSKANNGPAANIGTSIYVWRNDALKNIPVIAGASDDLYVEVHGGDLKEGDVVVTGLPVQEQ